MIAGPVALPFLSIPIVVSPCELMARDSTGSLLTLRVNVSITLNTATLNTVASDSTEEPAVTGQYDADALASSIPSTVKTTPLQLLDPISIPRRLMLFNHK
jgi:hypothetical protein